MRSAWRTSLLATTIAALFLSCGSPATLEADAEEPVSPGQRADASTPGRAGEDWPRFLGPWGDGKSKETGLDLEWPAEGPDVLWTVDVGRGYSMASVAGGRLFVFDRTDDGARLRCLDPDTGEERWRSVYSTDYEDLYSFSDGPRMTPVVDGEHVYTFGAEGILRCLRVEDGELVWQLDTREQFGVVQNFFGVGSTPLVDGHLLIVPVGGSPAGSPAAQSGEVQGNGSGLVAFDKLTGDVRWKSSDELAGYASPVIARIGGRRLGLQFARGGLLGFDPGSGEIAFHFPWRARKIESVNASNPVIVDDLVFLSESYGPGSALLRIGDGAPEVVWKDPPRPKSLSLHWMTPIHHEGYLYASSGSGSGDAKLRCVDFATGEVKWSEPGLGRSTILYADGRLIVLTEYGELLVVEPNPQAFRRIASVTPEDERGAILTHPAWNPPILSRGLLYARGKDRLACFDLRLRTEAGTERS